MWQVIFSFVLTLLLYSLLCPSAMAQGDEGAWTLSLDSVTVRGTRYRSPVRQIGNGVTIWDISGLSELPQILGNADPMHYVQMLPGVQTNNEYRSGISIEGCDNQHSAIMIDGIPIYNVSHLLGFFSTFNSAHFASMSIAKGLVSAASPNRLGGLLEMAHDWSMPDTVSGSVSLGLVSSQGTVALPINRKTLVKASLRTSYINFLYSRWLRADGQQVEYSFYDVNVSLFRSLNDKNRILIDFYSGSDDADFIQDHYAANVKAGWGNTMGGLHWLYSNGKDSAKTTAYFTHYNCQCSLDMQEMAYRMPSSIYDFGLKSEYGCERWRCGFEAILHTINPQSLVHQGAFFADGKRMPTMQSLETSFFCDFNQQLTGGFSIREGVRGSLYKKGRTAYGAIDPSFSIQYETGSSLLSATYALRHQYLFQTGFSDSGLPTEFWISASKDFKPQYTHEFTTGYTRFLYGHRLKVSVDLFYRQLFNQLGYKGSILDYVNEDYDIYKSLMHGKGKNYGFSLMLNKCSGRLTGWVSYTFTRARRSFDEISQRRSYPASHERPHELTALATYTLNDSWSFGGSLVYASGTPFTAAKSLYLLNNNIVLQYGDYNASRLKPYLRFDVSVNYRWGKEKEHGLNLSAYNVTSHDNELFYYLRTKSDGSFVYRPKSFVLNILPSFSYNYKF